jgi:hypothetical protein
MQTRFSVMTGLKVFGSRSLFTPNLRRGLLDELRRFFRGESMPTCMSSPLPSILMTVGTDRSHAGNTKF